MGMNHPSMVICGGNGHRQGSKKCEMCPKTISANKRFCHEHAIEEAKKAGLLK